MIELNEKSKVYVLCPAYVKTGGTELSHQLVFELNKLDIDAHMVYYYSQRKKMRNKDMKYTPQAFEKYVKDYLEVDEIEDTKDNVIVIPEVAIHRVKKLHNIRKAVWWMSVDNYTNFIGILKTLKNSNIKETLTRIVDGNICEKTDFKDIDYFLYQSYYSEDYFKDVKKEGYYLSDYINDSYLNINEKDKKSKRENIILYNPKKGYEFTKKIIDRGSDLKWIPLINKTNEEVKELLLKSKVYIDFGNHPGKDRFPREAAMCGCCIITGKRGSANYYKDVMIDDEFKFEDSDENIEKIINKINECLNNYDNMSLKFEKYRDFIKGEKENFIKDIQKIFVKKG